MSGRSFFDTNIVVYGFDRTDFEKTKASLRLLADIADTGVGVISYQVVQEVINVALHKFRPAMSPFEAGEYIQGLLEEFEIVMWSPRLVSRALEIRERHKFAWYDCLIVAAALEAKCDVLYTEDLQHGQRIEGLTVVNPFL
jgi:predicted nucleic acid-binding protein